MQGYCVLSLLVFLWSIAGWRLATRSLFDPFCLFFVACALFNAGQTFLEVFDLNKAGLMDGKFSLSQGTESDTILLTTLGLNALHLGGISCLLFSPHLYPAHRKMSVLHPSKSRAIQVVAWLLLLVALPPATMIGFDALSISFKSGYMALYNQEVPTGLDGAPGVLATFLVSGALLLLVGGSGKKSSVVITSTIVLLHFLTRLLSGWRLAATMPLIAYAWTFHTTVRRIPPVVLLTCASLCAFIVFPIIALTRNYGMASVDWTEIQTCFLGIDNPMICTISEMGGSMVTTAYTIELVPGSRPYDMGYGYVLALFTVVPNIFGGVHPSLRNGSYSDWLIQSVDPVTALRGGGLGFSIIAEAYANFGWYGVPAVLFLIGLAMCRLATWSCGSGDPLKIAVVACYLSFVLKFARDESNAMVRPFFWHSMLPYLAVIMVHKYFGCKNCLRFGEQNGILRSGRPGHSCEKVPRTAEDPGN